MGLTITCVISLLAMSSAAPGPDMVTVQPEDTGAALINPCMGFTMHFYSNVAKNYGSQLTPADTLDWFPGVSVVYLRIPWAYLEPEEGQYNWALLDTPAQRWIADGKRIALRLTCSENWMTFATPEWVRKAGAKGTFYQYGKGRVDGGGPWDPFFDDPVFLEKLDRFLAAAARRYDGNPNVDFIDVGTYGLWGEGHTHASSLQDSFELQKLHIDLHLKHFKNTLLCISDDYAGHDRPGTHFPITGYALSKGVTIRDDSIMVQPPPRQWYHAGMARAFWPELPVILESDHYGGSVGRGAWDQDRLLQAVEEYHASYMSIHWWPREFLEKNRAVIDRINMRLGYRLHPVQVTWPETVRAASTQKSYADYGDVIPYGDAASRFKVQWDWVNKGVAPCYPGAFPALTLKDSDGGIVAVLVDETLNMRDLAVGPPGSAPVTHHESDFIIGLYAPATKPGDYDLYVSAGMRDGTPVIALPLKDDDGQRRYRLGQITIAAKI
jgi:hypothetical protein